MELDAVVSALGLEAYRDTLAVEWQASQASLPAGLPYFLAAEFVVDACRYARLPAEVSDAAVRVAGRVGANAALSALAWHGHYCTYRAAVFPRDAIHHWPTLESGLGDGAGRFILLVLLSALSDLRALYAEHAVPAQVARDTLYDIERWMLVHHERTGQWGLLPNRLGWLRNHMRGELYHLTRLQFQFGRCADGYRVFRHRDDGTVLALAEAGLRFRADGQMDGAGGVVDEGNAWSSHLELTADHITGSPITPSGEARQQEVRLSRAEWRPVLAPGDPVLHLHIPAGSPMDYDLCGQSLQMALDFFPRHFPDHPFIAFTCSSWLLDAQLETLLPPSSNLVRFLQEMYLLPRRSSGHDTLERVFGGVPDDLRQAPRDTTLRRVLIDHLLAGGHLRGARSVLLPADLRWGEQVYRRQRIPWVG